MFYRPLIQPIAKSTVAIDAFGGYDHNLRIADGSLCDMKNLTSDNYPVLTPRKQRGTYWPDGYSYPPEDVKFATSNGNLYFMTADGLVVGEDEIIADIFAKDYFGREFQYVRAINNGVYIVFWGDDTKTRGAYAIPKYYNTVDSEDRGAIGTYMYYNRAYGYAGNVNEGNYYPLVLHLCDDLRNDYPDLLEGDLPDAPEDGLIVYHRAENDEDKSYIKRWSAEKEKWLDVEKLGFSFFRPSAVPDPEYDLAEGRWLYFYMNVSDGDYVTISKSDCYCEEKKAIWTGSVVGEFEGQRIWISNFAAMMELCEFWSDYSKGFKGFEDANYSKNTYTVEELYVDRLPPKVDFVIECNNRLWGCRYGKNHYGDFVNEIYAAKQGDFTNWHTFAGISTDSYVASCGATGPFTAAVNFNGRPLFFKENHYYLVSGDYPSEYGYTDGPIKGVQEGSGKSLVVIDRIAYYKGVDGIYAFDGYSATCISAALGDIYYKNACAGAYRNKYYISMQDANDAWHLFVYDTKKGLWHKEDDLRVDQFFNHENNLFYLVGGKIHCIDAETQPVYGVPEEEIEPPVEWMAETGNLTTGIPYKKYLSKLNVRMKVHKGASVRIFIQYDESGKWEELFYMTATAQRSFTIPIRPKRCDHIKLKLTGVGDVEIYSIIKTLEKGSDL